MFRPDVERSLPSRAAWLARRGVVPRNVRLEYYRHFGLERDPFLDTADPAFYLATPDRQRVERRLLGSIRQSRGITVVVGEPGHGKTSLASAIERELLLDDGVRLGKILDPSFSGEVEFLLAVARSFGLELPPRSPAALKNAFKNFLFDAAILEKHTVVLSIDEAQSLDPAALEALRLLQNYHVPERKLLNVVLFGQPELRTTVSARANFADRVDTWIELGPLDATESRALLAHRLGKAGRGHLEELFETEAVEVIVLAAAGTPRRILAVARGTLEEAALRGRERGTLEDALATTRARGIAVKAPAAPAAPVPVSPAPAPTPQAADLVTAEVPSESGRRRWSDLIRASAPWRRTKT